MGSIPFISTNKLGQHMSKMSDGGKGSSPRPYSVSQEEYNTRWDAIFSRDLPKEDTSKKEDTVVEDNSTAK